MRHKTGFRGVKQLFFFVICLFLFLLCHKHVTLLTLCANYDNMNTAHKEEGSMPEIEHVVFLGIIILREYKDISKTLISIRSVVFCRGNEPVCLCLVSYLVNLQNSQQVALNNNQQLLYVSQKQKYL